MSSIGSGVQQPITPVSYVARRPVNRVETHIHTLGILWIICGILRVLGIAWLWMVGRVFLPSVITFIPGFPAHSAVEHLIEGGVFFASGLMILQAVLAFVAAWGLLERQSWGRILGIVAGILALLRIPLGTALGIYTLWVLLPASSEGEYRNLVRA